ncbi:hypothetical protein FOFC_06925, partial [Fusarium oxysporum]
HVHFYVELSYARVKLGILILPDFPLSQTIVLLLSIGPRHNISRSFIIFALPATVTGQASSRPDELSFVILGTSSVEAAGIASLLEAELRQAHHRYKHCTVASLATCLAALKANSATHVFVIFDDVVGDIEDTVSDELCDEKTLGIAAKSAIIKFCVNRGIHCTFSSHGNFYRHDGRICFCESGFKEEAELNIKLLPNSLSTYVFHQVSTVAPLSLLKLMQWPVSSTQARKRRLRSTPSFTCLGS